MVHLQFDKFSFADLDDHAVFECNVRMNRFRFGAVDFNAAVLDHAAGFTFGRKEFERHQ